MVNGIEGFGGLKLFQEARHLGFAWPGGQPAALLVHGFPGTPAEVRPLAQLLQPMGWTVRGILLPGFGAQFETLGKRRYEEWLQAVLDALADQRAAGHRPIMLVGFSMGAALAIRAAAGGHADGLIVLAPFTWRQSGIQAAARSLLHPVAARPFRPFLRANFRNRRTRTMLLAFLPGVDLDDPAVQMALRQWRVPVSLFGQVLQAGIQAWESAGDVTIPSLVIQGRRDETVPVVRTRILVNRLANVVRYLEIEAGHQLIGPTNLAWPTVQEAVMDFAVRLEEGSLR
jgi:carboxylesterase